MKNFKELAAYKKSYKNAMDIFEISKLFPKEEKYSLTDQIRRSSRSIPANIAEAYRKRRYPNHFISKLSDADMECSETHVWIDFCLDCTYISKEQHQNLLNQYIEIGKLIGYMIKNPNKFL
jgi:four helix bundle protein